MKVILLFLGVLLAASSFAQSPIKGEIAQSARLLNIQVSPSQLAHFDEQLQFELFDSGMLTVDVPFYYKNSGRFIVKVPSRVLSALVSPSAREQAIEMMQSRREQTLPHNPNIISNHNSNPTQVKATFFNLKGEQKSAPQVVELPYFNNDSQSLSQQLPLSADQAVRHIIHNWRDYDAVID